MGKITNDIVYRLDAVKNKRMALLNEFEKTDKRWYDLSEKICEAEKQIRSLSSALYRHKKIKK
jgi:hypothetical protein